MRRALAGLVSIAIAWGAQHTAAAQTRDPIAAEALFKEARGLMRARSFVAACPKLEASMKLDPAVGTALNLGECFEKIGRSASAWLMYRRAAAIATQTQQATRISLANRLADALEPMLCRLIIEPPASGLPATAIVMRDEVPIEAATLGTALPVDPGKHHIRASAPGFEPHDAEVTIAAPSGRAPCGTSKVVLPALVPAATPTRPSDAALLTPAAPAPPPTLPAAVPPASAPATEPDVVDSGGWRAPHTVAVVLGGMSLAAFGVAGGFSLDALAKKRDGDAACGASTCTPDGHALLEDAGRRADVATGFSVAGGVVLAAAAVVWLVSPSLAPSRPAAPARTGVSSSRPVGTF